jgi:hypothetical protein
MKGENMKYLLCIVLLVFVIITAGCVQPEPATLKVTPTPTPTSCENKCNDICYDILWNDCCGDTIYPHDNSNFKTGSCCGGKWYPLNETGTCCGGMMYPTNNSRTCCGGKMYDGYSNDCCGDVMYSREESMSSWCCGGKMYPNIGNGWSCCAYSRPDLNGIWYNENTQHCCEGKVESGAQGGGWAKCGEICYQPITQSCCRGWDSNTNKSVIIIKQGKDSCCIDLPFQIPDDQKCNPTDGSITPKNYTGYNCKGNYGPAGCGDLYSQYSVQNVINKKIY